MVESSSGTKPGGMPLSTNMDRIGLSERSLDVSVEDQSRNPSSDTGSSDDGATRSSNLSNADPWAHNRIASKDPRTRARAPGQ